jgi:peptidyl-prolyl cis-trans isomerase A (cyclophilin A)
MAFRFALLAFAPLLLAAAPAQKSVAPVADTVRVSLNTEMGAIVVDLDAKHAPVTTTNFLRYVDQKRFDGMVFYRSMKLDWGTPPNGLIQAGLRGNPKLVFKPIAHEPTNVTGILHKAGTISMARLGPGTATADFSILLSDLPSLDANPAGTGDTAGYAAFGQVVEGMDVARHIWDAPRSTTLGSGVMKGEMIAKPVKVLTVRRVKIPPVATAPANP